MKRLLIGLVACLLVVGMSSFAFAQGGADDIINKLALEKVNNMIIEVENGHHYMYLNVTLRNDNEGKELLLTENTFTFYICGSQDYQVCRNEDSPEVTKLGMDVKHAGTKEDIGLPADPKDTGVVFKVDLGTDQASVLEKTVEILNFVGNDPESGRTFFIRGKFDLGIKTNQGWTYAQAIRVEWQFCPVLQEELPIESCFE